MTFNLESMEREAKAMADGPYRYGEGQNLLALIADYKRLKAENESLRKDRTDWQAECLKLGFEYVRAPDDHYVLADVPEMARLLAQLLGVEVRDKENDSHGETISELHEQVEAGNNAFHRAYAAEAECDRLKEEVEALRSILSEARSMLNTVSECSSHECEDCREHAGLHRDGIDLVIGKSGES